MSTIEAPAIQAPKEVTTADVLHRAADLLEEFGWLPGPWHAAGEDGHARDPLDWDAVRFCLVGSLIRSRIDLGLRPFSRSDEGHLFCYRELGHGSSWNDEPGRTKYEVVSLLREAAERSTG